MEPHRTGLNRTFFGGPEDERHVPRRRLQGFGTSLTGHGSFAGMRVLFANATHRWGGVKSWTLAVGESLVRRGHDVTIVLRPGDPFGDAAEAAGIRVRRLVYGPDWNPAAISWFLAAILEDRPDVIVTNVGKDNRTAGVAARLSGVPVVHRVGGPGDLVDRAAIRWTQRHVVTRIVVPSSSTRVALLAHRWIDPSRVAVIPNGIDLDRFRPGIGAGRLRAEIGAAPSDRILGTTGQLTVVKGHRFLLDAFARLLEKESSARLVLIGTGPEDDPLREQAKTLGISGRVHFQGFSRELPELLEDFDVAVQPSIEEGLPHSVIEFMAKEKPVVASRLAGIAEAVVDGETGLLVPPGDATALAEALRQLLADRERRLSMGASGRQRAVREFGLDTMIDRVETLFKTVADEGRNGGR